MSGFLDKLKGKVEETTHKYQQHQSQGRQQEPLQPDAPHVPQHPHQGPMRSIAWPPKLKDEKIAGYVSEINGHDSIRDIGRSFQLSGHTYYLLGDTFCYNDKHDFVGLASNAIAYVPDTNKPRMTEMLYGGRNGKKYYVHDWIPHTTQETQFNEQNKDKRVILWCFGGIIEDSPGSNTGWCFPEAASSKGAQALDSHGTALCRVTAGSDPRSIRAERVGDGYIFGPHEPHFGVHSLLKDEATGFVYLLGKDQLDNCLARIPIGTPLTERGAYEFLAKGGHWVKQFKTAKDELEHILGDMAQGSIIKPPWAPKDKPYVYIGAQWWMTSKLWVCAAPKMEGPWDMHHLTDATRLNNTSNFRYCIFPHEWTWKPNKGELFVSWSEDNPTRIVGSRLTFELAD